MANGLNEATIKALPIPEKGNRVHYFAGAVLQGITAPRGFGVRVTAGGAKAFVLNYRLRGREFRYTVGQFPDWSALRAVRTARDLRQRIDRGDNPLDDRVPPAAPEAPKTVADVIEDFLKRYVRSPSGPLRSVKEYERALLKQVAPAIGGIPIYELRRSQIAEMLDKVEDERGPVQVDRTLAYFRKCLNWYATRDDRFVPPIVPGMARSRAKDRARERVLSDDEIRTIWPHLTGTFGALVKTLLLTAQRRNEVARMAWPEIGKDGLWTIPAERYKTKRAAFVPLSKAALAVIEAQPKIAGCDFVFATRARSGKGRGAERANVPDTANVEDKALPGGWRAFSGFSKTKPALDKAITAANEGKPLPRWTLHDLRRTAKTIMQRAGVRPDISERVLGHIIAGVEGVYDRHSYLDEKRDALEKLAAMAERILHPSPSENVVPLRHGTSQVDRTIGASSVDAYEEQVADQLAFEECFPPSAFAGVASALEVPTDPANLDRLRRWLLRDFHAFYFTLPGKQRSREERIRHLRQLHEAAAKVGLLLRGYGLMTLPIDLFGADDEPHAVSDAFKATLVGVAEAASEAADRLASARLPRGRPRKNDPFRELVIHLIRKYERLTHEPAGCPYWLPDSGIYGGKGRFWKFACAVWRCLYHHGPELRPVLPDTEEALGQELRKHWPSSETGNNSLDCD